MNANVILNIRSAARQICRSRPIKLTCTAAELDARLGALGCHVDAQGNFSVFDLLRAVRVNVEPVGPRLTSHMTDSDAPKLARIVTAWSNAARP